MKFQGRYLSLLLLLIGLTLPSLAQTSLQGIIQNGVTNSPLPLANVFLANTTLGTVSGEDGKFRLTNVPQGRLELIVSCIGFETLHLSVQTSDPKFYRLILKPAEYDLLNVTVKAKRSNQWKENLAFFESHFLATSEDAYQCKLVNPEVLAFFDTLNVFKAQASDLIVVENKGLGYRLKYALLAFSFDYQTKLISFKGYPFYEPLTPKDEKEAQHWQTNREKAYRGSTLHFMRSLYHCRLYQEGFLVQPIVEKIDKTGRPRLLLVQGKNSWFYPTPADTVVRQILDIKLTCRQLVKPMPTSPTELAVSFKGMLQVTYTKEREPFRYQRSLYPTQKEYVKAPQVSIIKLIQPQLILEANGHFYEPDGLVSQGYWSWELLAEMLPFDYSPPL